MSLPKIVQAVNARVSLAGDESISDVKTFTNSPRVPAIGNEDDFTTKAANTKFVKTAVRHAVDELQKQINALEGVVLTATDNTAVAYSKSIPTSANLFKYAAIRNYGGRSLAWNQFIEDAYSFTFAAGTARQQHVKRFNAIAGHKYVFTCRQSATLTSVTRNTFYIEASTFSFENTSENYHLSAGYRSWIWTATTTEQVWLGFWCNAPDIDVTYDKFQATDLTLAFGAGNEPSTVEEFRAMFPDEYYAYTEGEIKSAGVNKIVSQGRNLFDADGFFTGISGWTGQQFAGKIADIHNKNLIGSYEYATQYAVSLSAENVNASGPRINIQYTDGTTETQYVFSVQRAFFVTESGKTVESIYFNYGSNGDVIVKEILVEKSTVQNPYVPYFETEKAIPTAILALPGYGWSAGTVFNEIDWERKVYIQRVAQVDLGDLSWVNSSAYYRIYTTDLSNAVAKPDSDGNIANLACSKFSAVPVNNVLSGMTGISVSQSGTVSAGIGSNDRATMDALIQSLPGVKLNYELATPVETDISALLDDNTIEVESGGSLTFENANGDSYRIPVPSSVVTMEKP